ncbi:bifunctional enoyl-CoA hydratase/phosphate acetyltransferase [candidate division KSB1 bacterium]|jgi:phosphate butyryltransferase|nr:bifunctional enoyl-CoA hydratase/phosphate acetyltransferase [candidate division KSB1 bacterium]
MNMIESFDEMMELARQGEPVSVAIAAGQDPAAFAALIDAVQSGIAVGHLYGHKYTINKMLRDIPDLDRSKIHVYEARSILNSAEMAVNAVRDGTADLVLKGKLKSSELLKAVLHPEKGLRTGKHLSDVFIFENPNRPSRRLTFITDGGVTLNPHLNQKLDIINNAVMVAHALGNDEPKVAILSAVETVNKDLEATNDAAILTKMNHRGQIKGCIIDGPLALDNALSIKAAEMKSIKSKVAGDADILVCPDIESANMLAKSTTYIAHMRLAHVVVGAAAPVLIPSRADTADSKLLSIALGKIVKEYLQTLETVS